MTTFLKSPEKISRIFLIDLLAATIHGMCYQFAIALHRGLGWPIVGLFKEGKIIHAGNRSPEGKIWDGRGEITEEKFAEPFISDYPRLIEETSEKILLDILAEIYFSSEVMENVVNSIQSKAQIAWPDLPWKNKTISDRIRNFAAGLEALSRKNGLWISANSLNLDALIFPANGDELGYEIGMSMDGGSWTIRRVLE